LLQARADCTTNLMWGRVGIKNKMRERGEEERVVRIMFGGGGRRMYVAQWREF
jgi:hypothetical protein